MSRKQQAVVAEDAGQILTFEAIPGFRTAEFRPPDQQSTKSYNSPLYSIVFEIGIQSTVDLYLFLIAGNGPFSEPYQEHAALAITPSLQPLGSNHGFYQSPKADTPATTHSNSSPR